MTFRIISPRIGTPGDVFTPEEGVNIEALIVGGFIEEADKPKVKSAKTENTSEKE